MKLSWFGSWFGCALSLALAACNGSTSSSREPADEADATTGARDASVDAARDGATMDASSGGDAGSQADDAGTTPDAQVDAALPAVDSYVYIGGWGNGDYPVKTYQLDVETGALTLRDTSTAFGKQPSFITANAAGSVLYMTNEDGSAPGITVATIDPATGKPSKLAKRDDPGGGGLVHAAISPDGKTLLAADYNKGRLVDFPIAGDGKLGAAIATVSFGNDANTHSAGFHPNGRWAFSPNKGIDIVGQLEVANDGKISRRKDLNTAGDGPRMIAIAKDGRFAYVMFENDASLEAYSIDGDGFLKQIDREETLPDDYDGDPSGAHAALHPNGKFLYVSNRGSNTLVAFRVANDGTLMQVGQIASGGKTPRCFAIDPSGRWMVVANQADANQNNGNLVVFAIGDDGKLTATGSPVTGLQEPTAVAIVPKP